MPRAWEIELSNVNPAAANEATVLDLLQAAKSAAAAGRGAQAEQLLARAGQLAPNHPAVLNDLGVNMMQRGDAEKANALFQRATAIAPEHAALWSNLATSLHELQRLDDELIALERALALEPRHLPSLLQKGALLEIRGEERRASRTYRSALATIPRDAEPLPTVREALDRAREIVRKDEDALSSALQKSLASLRQRHATADFRRAQKCLDMLTGRRSRYFPNPHFMCFPEIPAVEFFDRKDFPWLDAVEAATDEIRTELTNVLVSDRSGLEPYIAYPDGVPLDQWRELNKSRRWSAYFLWNQSVPQPSHQARCPLTTRVMQAAPQCVVPGSAPTVFFSILDVKTRIPAHTGATNTRLTVHLPLIVPPGCGFRVGNETREWVPGKAWVFDDTIDHEAWNDSDVPRAVLIFDIWNPYLTPAERDLVSIATDTYAAYYRSKPEEV